MAYSMKDFITANRVATSIMLSSGVYKGGHLLTEGDTDVIFYSAFCNKACCKVQSLIFKKEVVEAIRILNQRNAKGILAIVDPDYWLAKAYDPKMDNLIFGDVHDIDVSIFLSSALEKFVSECLPARNYEKVEAITNQLRQLCFKIASEIGLMRWVNDNLSLPFDFKNLPYDRFCDFDKMEVNTKELFNTLACTHKSLPKTDLEIFEEYEKLKKLNKDSTIISQGHDLANLVEFILPKIIKQILGNDSCEHTLKKIPFHKIPMMLRLAFERRFFKNTIIFRRILEWQNANSSYIMFALD